jgi:hypothetical protein
MIHTENWKKIIHETERLQHNGIVGIIIIPHPPPDACVCTECMLNTAANRFPVLQPVLALPNLKKKNPVPPSTVC